MKLYIHDKNIMYLFRGSYNEVFKKYWSEIAGFKEVIFIDNLCEAVSGFVASNNILPRYPEYVLEKIKSEDSNVIIFADGKPCFYNISEEKHTAEQQSELINLTDWTYSTNMNDGKLFIFDPNNNMYDFSPFFKQRIAIYSTIKAFELDKLRSQMEMYAYHINANLGGEYELIFKPLPSRREIYIALRNKKPFDLAWATHAIVCEQRGIKAKGAEYYEALRSKTFGLICTFCGSHTNVNKEDILFYTLPSGKSRKKHCRLVNWAAEPSILYPEQSDPGEEIRVLIDHPYYGAGRIGLLDMTKNTVSSFIDYKESCEKPVIMGRKFVSGACEDVVDKTVDRYVHVNLNYKDTCYEYRHAHVFVVTHLESMGLSVLESAMCGALIVVPICNGESYIKHCLIKNLHHITYDVKNGIDWEAVIKKIDVVKARKKALRYTWKKSIGVMKDTFDNWFKYKYEKDLIFKNRHG